jgi:tRNA G18 (ribose-2'-O)-methylase SpoU
MTTTQTPFNVADEYKNLSVEEINTLVQSQTRDFSICCLNVDGDLNIGSLIRTASLLGAETSYVFGRRRIDNRGLLGANHYHKIDRIHGLTDAGELDFDAFESFVEEEGLLPIFVEQGGISLDAVDWNSITYAANYTATQPMFVFGNESTGIPPDFLDRCVNELFCSTISIPQVGALRSFNVSAAGAIVMWEYVRQMKL